VPVTTAVATNVIDCIAALEAELAAEQQRSADHADFDHHDRANRLVAVQERMIAELKALRDLLEAIQAGTTRPSRRRRLPFR
jgi:hypothetical protein